MPHKDPEANREYFRKYLKEYRKRPGKAEQSRARCRAFYVESKASGFEKLRQERMMERRRIRKAQLVAVFGGCCENCGFTGDPSALDFDHIDPSTKSTTIAFLIGRGATPERLMAEANLCRLLCANCHRVVSSKGSLPPQIEYGMGGC